MERKVVNSAAGTAISNHGNLVPQKTLIRYQVSLAVLDTMLRNGELSEWEHGRASAVLACHYGLECNSIFR